MLVAHLKWGKGNDLVTYV